MYRLPRVTDPDDERRARDEDDGEALTPRPWSLVAAALVTSSLGLLEARQAEAVLRFLRDPMPPRPVTFPMAVQAALWSCAQDHLRAMVAVEAARLVLAVLLFVAASRVLLRAQGSGWLWRQALAGNVAVTLAAAWHERSLIPAWTLAFRRALAEATPAIASPQKSLSAEEFFRLTAGVSVWTTGALAAMFLAALAYASRPATRAITG